MGIEEIMTIEELKLIQKLADSLSASILYSQSLERRINDLEVEFKKHKIETRVHGFR